MPFVLGIDSSVQGTRVELRDADSGELFGAGRAAHPAVDGPRREQDPNTWWNALVDARRDAGGALSVSAVAVAAQTQGMVVLDQEGSLIRPAKLRGDVEAARAANALVDRLGGPAPWVHAVGASPTADFPIAKLAWLRREEPEAFERVAKVMAPADWLTFRLSRKVVTDRANASATGYFSATSNQWCADLLSLVDDDKDWSRCVPRVLGPKEVAGDREGVMVAAGTGDLMAAAMGVGLRARDVVVSIDPPCVFTVRDRATEDQSGRVANYADASGRYLPSVASNPASDLRGTFTRLLGIDPSNFDHLALETSPGAGGVTLTPPRPRGRRSADPTAALSGISNDTSPAQIARASVESLVHGLLDDIDHLRHADVPVGGRLILLGGARSHALPQVLADLSARPVSIPKGDRTVAGACVHGAAAVTGAHPDEIAEQWGLDRLRELEPNPNVDARDLRAQHRAQRTYEH
jgi:xylulokinase